MKTDGGASRLGVRVPRLPLMQIRVPGVMAAWLVPTQLVRVQVLGGVLLSEPSLALWAHRPIGGRRCRMPEISVQLRVGPLQSIQSCSLVAKAAPLQGDDRWFESTQDYSRPDTQIGKAVRLRPGCLQVRLRAPPEGWSWVLGSIASSWSSLECSPACHAGGHGFKSHRGRF